MKSITLASVTSPIMQIPGRAKTEANCSICFPPQMRSRDLCRADFTSFITADILIRAARDGFATVSHHNNLIWLIGESFYSKTCLSSSFKAARQHPAIYCALAACSFYGPIIFCVGGYVLWRLKPRLCVQKALCVGAKAEARVQNSRVIS